MLAGKFLNHIGNLSMNDRSEVDVVGWVARSTEGVDREIRRANARLRHFRGVAVSVMDDAYRLWGEIWDALQVADSCDEILEGRSGSRGAMPDGERSLLLEKLHLLGIQIDYARRLCDGSIGATSHEEGDH